MDEWRRNQREDWGDCLLGKRTKTFRRELKTDLERFEASSGSRFAERHCIARIYSKFEDRFRQSFLRSEPDDAGMPGEGSDARPGHRVGQRSARSGERRSQNDQRREIDAPTR